MKDKKAFKKLDLLERKAFNRIRQVELLKIVQEELTDEELTEYIKYYTIAYGFNPFNVL